MEIGIYKCGLFNQMIPYAERLTGVDMDRDAGNFMQQSKKTEFINTSSIDFFSQNLKKEGLYDLIFIDADHSKESIKDDFLNSIKVLEDDGIILLHDTYPLDRNATAENRCGDGYLAIENLGKQTTDWELVTIPLHPGLTICRKRNRQTIWQKND